MSLTRRIFFGTAAGWFSRATSILLGMILMPVLFRTLPREELGIWLLLGQSWGTLGVLDLGFGVTLTRRIAFAQGKSGSDPNSALSDENRIEISNLVATGLRIYRGIALLAFTVAFGLGFAYLRGLTLDAVTLPSIWAAWGILCLSQAMIVWATPWTCLLQGVGYVGWDAILSSFVATLTLVTQIATALFGGGLIPLAIVAATGALTQRAVILGFTRRTRPDLFRLRGKWQRDIFYSMAPLAFKAWLTSLGLMLVLNTDQFFVAKLEDIENLPAYRAAYVVLLNLNVLAVTVASASSVFVTQLWQQGDLAQVHRVVLRNLRFGLLIISIGGGCLIGLGESFFDLWLGPGNFIGYPIMLTFFLLLLLEAQCYIISTASRATEDEAFVTAALGSGFLKLGFSWVLGVHFGLLGIAVGTLLAQICTNHWFVVFRGLSRLRMSVKRHLVQVMLPVVFVSCAIFSVVSGLRSLMHGASDGFVVLSAALISAALVSVMFWFQFLEPQQRRYILRSVRRH